MCSLSLNMVSYLNPALAGQSRCFAFDCNWLIRSLRSLIATPTHSLRSFARWGLHASYAHRYHCAHTQISACIVRPQRTSQNHCCQPTRYARGTLRVPATLCRIIPYMFLSLSNLCNKMSQSCSLDNKRPFGFATARLTKRRLPLGYGMTLSHSFATRTLRSNAPFALVLTSKLTRVQHAYCECAYKLTERVFLS
jgi:hypothetical protein